MVARFAARSLNSYWDFDQIVSCTSPKRTLFPVRSVSNCAACR